MKNISPAPAPLQARLKRYETALDFLNLKTSLSKEQILEILAARDELGKELEAQKPIPVAILPQLIELDSHLKQHAYKITQVLELAEYRETLPISAQAWWWNLETRESSHPCNRFDGVLKIIRLIVWTGNLALLGTLMTRFLSGGSGLIEALAIAVPSVFSLLQANSQLTESGQKAFEKGLTRWGIPQHFQEEVKLVSTFLITLLLFGVWCNISSISQRYNRQGFDAQERGKLALAEKNYLKAIELEPENLDAHYNLGTLYEDLQDLDNAQKQYLLAAKGGLADADNNLARLYIRGGKSSEALKLLLQGLKLIKEKEKNSEPQTEEDKQEFLLVKYSLLKNLGWANFELKRDKEAQPYLLAAIGIASKPGLTKSLPNPGAAHCLLAQVLERQKQPDSSIHWQQCRSLVESRLAAGEQISSEEDTWRYLAKQQLERTRKSRASRRQQV